VKRLDARTMALAAAAVLCAAAMFGPDIPAERGVVEQFVVLDVTQSMNVRDVTASNGVRVSRLAAAKAALSNALEVLPCGSKLGFGLFTEHRALMLLAPVEVCAHRVELAATLAQIDGRMAWAGNSEVAKGLNSALRAARELSGLPAVVFVTDGHEAPPIDPAYRPAFDEELARAGIRGVVVGVGGEQALPIPKTDPEGRAMGFWQPNEVAQLSPRSAGRGGSVEGEKMVDDPERGGRMQPLPGAAPGSEHLSSLRAEYLQLLAVETGLRYHHLGDTDGFVQALSDPSLQRPRPARRELGPWLGAAALVLLMGSLGFFRSLMPRRKLSQSAT
jgi:mxaL protein